MSDAKMLYSVVDRYVLWVLQTYGKFEHLGKSVSNKYIYE